MEQLIIEFLTYKDPVFRQMVIECVLDNLTFLNKTSLFYSKIVVKLFQETSDLKLQEQILT